jgi:hypothetical protein
MGAEPKRTAVEIAWVAGIYEGEGSCGPKVGGKGSLRSAIVQNDTWILERIRAMYGGGIYKRRTLFKGKWYEGHVLQMSGGPTREMLRDILPLLSPWRQAQARAALEMRPPRPRATAERCVHGHLWAEFGVREPNRGWRFCRACKRDGERRRYRENDARRRVRLDRLQARRREAPLRLAWPDAVRYAGVCRRGHALTPANTIWNPARGRQCRACWTLYRPKARTPIRPPRAEGEGRAPSRT